MGSAPEPLRELRETCHDMRQPIATVLALAAAGREGAVAVQIRRRKGAVVLVVEDDGPGFGEIPSRPGLGLAAVARNVIRHGGSLECASSEHGGARVSLWLPLGTSAGGAGPMRLVLCDDNRILCEALAAALEARGHQVLATTMTTAAGLAGKDSSIEQLLRVVRGVARGETWLPPAETGNLLSLLVRQRDKRKDSERMLALLTPRERQVLACLAEGAGRRQVADRAEPDGQYGADAPAEHHGQARRPLGPRSSRADPGLAGAT